jgi:hypothetical protein
MKMQSSAFIIATNFKTVAAGCAVQHGALSGWISKQLHKFTLKSALDREMLDMWG